MTRAKPTAPELPLPLQFLAAWLAMWVGRHQQHSVAYLREENQVLRARLGTKRLRLADPERRRLASLGVALGRKTLTEVATIATPDTILRWYRELVAAKYDGSKKRRGPGRPRKPAEIVRLLLKMAAENPTWGYTRHGSRMVPRGSLAGTVEHRLLLPGAAPRVRTSGPINW